MADLLSLEQITELKEAFAKFDSDCDGFITLSDVESIYRSAGYSVDAATLECIVREADTDFNGLIDFAEFLALFATRHADNAWHEAQLRQAFELYDVGNTGFINVSNMRVVMKRLGCALTSEQAFTMMDEVGCGDSGRISFDVFKRIMQEDEENIV